MSVAVIATPNQHFIDAEISFITPESPIVNARYVTPGQEINTAKYDAHKVKVYDARANEADYTLDSCGFTLAKHESKVEDLRNRELLDTEYTREMEEFVKTLTGADLVLAFGVCLRASTATAGGKYQEPGVDAHCDYNTETAVYFARDLLDQRGFKDFEYKDFECINVWRAISKPPQDWPLAVCQAQTAGHHEKYFNKMVVTEPPLDLENLPPVPDERLPTAILYEFQDRFRWNFFSNMVTDEVLAFKLFDSRKHLPCRCPHAAFKDKKTEGVLTRESVEIRTVAYFKK